MVYALPLLVLALYLTYTAGRYALATSNSASLDGGSARQSFHDARTLASQSWALAPELTSPNIRMFQHARMSGNTELATSHLLDALNSRISWPYDWMSLAELLAQQAVFDERMTAALQGVVRYGASERSLEYRKALFAVRYWYGFSEEQRSQVEPAVLSILNQKKLAYLFFFDLERLQRGSLFCRRYAEQFKYGEAWCIAFEERRRKGGAG